MGGKGSGRKRTTPRKHGTWNCYANGCRCGACRKAWRAYIAARRARLRPRRYYEEGTDTVVVRLSPLSRQILQAALARTKKTSRDIVEHLLRLHGGAVQFEDAA